MKSLPTVTQPLRRVERLLAGLLRYGAWTAAMWMALGLLLDVIGGALGWKLPPFDPTVLMSIGLVLLIALPVLRIALMLALFALEKDYRFAAIAAVVLLVIAVGFVLGLWNPHFAAG